MAKINKFYENTIELKNFLYSMGVRPGYFALPVFLSFLTAFFDGIRVGLLVPMLQGLISMDFSFVKNIPILRTAVSNLAQIFGQTTQSNLSILILLLGAIFIFSAIKIILSYLSAATASYQTRRFSENMRAAIFSRYLSFGKLFFDRTNIGRLNAILFSFTEEVVRLLDYLRKFTTDVFTLIFFLIIMSIISWKVTIFALLLFPIFYFSVNRFIERIKTISETYAGSRINQAWKAFDILSCIPLIKSYSSEKQERRHFLSLNKQVAQLEYKRDKKILLIEPIQELIVITMLLLLVSVAAFMYIQGKIETLASFLVFFYIFRRGAPLFNILNNFHARLAEVQGSINSISQMLDDKDKFLIPQGNEDFNGLKSKIEFVRVNFSYIEGVQVLQGISLSIEKGKMTAIVGPTGSGKTTLVNLILRFYDSHPGSIFIDGTDIRDFTLSSLRAHMALVSQDSLLFNDTIRNNISYGLDGQVSEGRLTELVKKARLYDFIMRLPEKLNTLVGDRGIKLSGGEKQRLSIARALLKGSEILILDEATSSLDTRTERLIQQAIDEAVKGRTAIVIAHRLSTIKHADKIIVIEGGRLIEQGSLEELLEKKGTFSRYWEEQKFY